MSWEKLGEAYRGDGLVLALGAGISKASNLPTWEELLLEVARVRLPPDGPDLVRELRAAGYGLPAITSVLRIRCGEGQFTEFVRNALYQRFAPYHALESEPEYPRPLKLQLTREAGEANTSLRAAAALCVLPSGDAGPGYRPYCRNPRIQAVINFNLDALFRTYVEARYGDPFVRTIERASKAHDRAYSSRHGHDRIPLYHVHGFLRFDKKARKPASEASDRLVLTEQDYFDFTNNSTGVFTYTFLYLLREYSCLFMGLSMRDENIRRLLHYLHKERVAAYREEGLTAAAIEEKAIRHFAVLPRFKSRHLDGAVQQSLRALGVAPIYVSEDFAELPAKLGRVYSGDDTATWAKVYDSTPPLVPPRQYDEPTVH